MKTIKGNLITAAYYNIGIKSAYRKKKKIEMKKETNIWIFQITNWRDYAKNSGCYLESENLRPKLNLFK